MIRKHPEVLSPFAVGLVLFQAIVLFSPVGAILELIFTVLLFVTIRALRKE